MTRLPTCLPTYYLANKQTKLTNQSN